MPELEAELGFGCLQYYEGKEGWHDRGGACVNDSCEGGVKNREFNHCLSSSSSVGPGAPAEGTKYRSFATYDDTIDVQLDPVYEVLSNQILEGRVELLADFLESCNTTNAPYNPVKMLSVLNAFAPLAPVHTSLQICLAESMHTLLPAACRCPAFLKAVLNIHVFDVYAANLETEKSHAVGWWLHQQPWLADPVAHQTTIHCLAGYPAVLSAGTDAAVLR
ncbi:hypothetical protein B0H17DRAFT_1144176 [Mycena rosella]|uniref:Uncharacterized protein n=1 Tax=Mycena rosella TaxID=1033263 RepID=A0AAD7G3P4_MYCRO|nr:hypothetical protein B0H17DRAFT_1144176 [Mycena rosella]